jgi:hypothetical protein
MLNSATVIVRFLVAAPTSRPKVEPVIEPSTARTAIRAVCPKPGPATANAARSAVSRLTKRPAAHVSGTESSPVAMVIAVVARIRAIGLLAANGMRPALGQRAMIEPDFRSCVATKTPSANAMTGNAIRAPRLSAALIAPAG